MALQNRVTPLGELVADPARGLVYGNRGCLHDAEGRIRRRYAGKRWIACRLEFRGRRRSPLLQPGRYTELFFLDEATAFAAGHRPCAECRREDYVRFQELWRELGLGPANADAIDERLHAERLDGRVQRRHEAAFGDLPDGAFVLHDGVPQVVLGRRLLAWTPGGYTARTSRPRGGAVQLTPPSLAAVLHAGWDPAVPLLHPSADAYGAAEGHIVSPRCPEAVCADELAAIQAASHARADPALRSSWSDERTMGSVELAEFLDRHTYCVVATATERGRAQARPVAFAVLGAAFWLATVEGGRLRNLRREPWLSLVVSEGDGDAHRAVVVDGPVTIHERPPEAVLALWEQRTGSRAEWAVAWLELRPSRVFSYTRAP